MTTRILLSLLQASGKYFTLLEPLSDHLNQIEIARKTLDESENLV